VLLSVFLTLVIVGLLGYGFFAHNQLNDTKKDLAATRTELTTTQADLASSQVSLANTEIELAKAQGDLANSESELSATQNDLQSTNQQLVDKSSQLVKAQADYVMLEKTLDIEKESFSQLQSNLQNLQASYNSLTTGYGYVLRDPTYQEMKTFIAADKTDTNTYVDPTYVCEDFAYDVRVHAMQQKIRCAFVTIHYPDSAHAIVAFNTTDKGIIYIEPQSDEEVNLHAGYHFYQCIIAEPGYYYAPPGYDDTIERFNVFW
jgi:myosin heavy subunit